MANGDEELARVAPVVAGVLDEVEAAAWLEADRADFLDLIQLVAVGVAEQHGLHPLTFPEGLQLLGPGHRVGDASGPVEAPTDTDRALVDFALQFSVDVSRVTDGQRRDLFRLLGDQAANFTAAVFVMDFLPRTRAALDALARAEGPGGGDARPRERGSGSPGLLVWDALGALIREVPRLDAVDPITSELVRLRGARQHQCRLCQSLRSRPALVAGADEELFVLVDDYEGSSLEPLQKAALAFTDAMIWTPAHLDSQARRLAGLASPAQSVEIVLDVTRNALNKIAVALGADAAHVEDGIEIYDIDDDGELAYGLTLD
jgi:alkylhydroperoxidase family enzyme